MGDSALSARQPRAHLDPFLGTRIPDDLWRLAMARSGIPMCLVAPEGRFVEVNPALCEFFGYDADTLHGLTWQELTHPADLAADLERVQRIADGSLDHYRLTKRYLRSSGEIVVGDLNVSSVRDNDGALRIMLVQIVDVTQQELDRASRQESEERFRLLAETTNAAVALYSADGTLLWASPSWRTVLGREPGDVEGTRTESFVHPHDRQLAADAMRQAVRDQAQTATARFRALHADGSVRWMDADIGLVWSGDMLAYSKVAMRDVTEQVQAEELLAASEERYRLLAENSMDVVMKIDADHRVEWASPSVLTSLGVSASAMVGRRMTEFVHPDDLGRVTATTASWDATGAAGRITMRVRTGRNRYRWFEEVSAPVLTGGGRARGRAVRLRDIDAEVRAAESLAASEELFRRAMADSGAAMALLSPEGSYIEVNSAMCRMFGYDGQKLRTMSWQQLAHPDDLTVDLELERQMVAGEIDTYRIVKRYIRADGSHLVGDVTVSAIRDSGGVMLRFVSQIVDITEQQRVRHELEQSEEHFRLLAENATDLVLRVGRSGVIEWASPSFEPVLGYRPDDIVGHVYHDFLTGNDKIDTMQLAAELRPDEPTRRTVQLRRADGSFSWFSGRGALLVDADGRPTGSVIGLRNIDTEITAIRALSASEERFHAAMASAPGGMAVVGLDRGFVEVNDALTEMLGRPAAWLLSHGMDDVLHPGDDRADQQLREQVLSGRLDSGVLECRLVRAGGSVIWVQHAVALLHSSDQAPSAYVSQFVDITGAKQAREDLEFLARHDPLTRLDNRRALVDGMRAILSQRPRGHLQPGLLYLDLDGFKPVNDDYGHGAGDEVLVHVADRIRAAVRTEDVVARIGGDEFVVLLPAVRGLDDVVAVGDKIRQSIRRPMTIVEGTVGVTASVGATLALPGEDPDDVIRRADRALYRAKEQGRDRTVGQEPAP